MSNRAHILIVQAKCRQSRVSDNLRRFPRYVVSFRPKKLKSKKSIIAASTAHVVQSWCRGSRWESGFHSGVALLCLDVA